MQAYGLPHALQIVTLGAVLRAPYSGRVRPLRSVPRPPTPCSPPTRGRFRSLLAVDFRATGDAVTTLRRARTPRGGLPLRAGASLSLTGDSHAPQRALLAKPPHAITSRPPSASIGLAQGFALGSMLFFAYGLGLRAPDEITLGAVLRAPLGARSPPPLRAATPSDLQSTANSSLSLPVGGGLSGYGGRSHYATQGSPCPSCLRAPVIAPARPNGVRRL